MEFPELAREMELILEKSPFLMMNRSRTGTILRISKKAADALALTRQNAEGRALLEVMDKNTAALTIEKDEYLCAHPDHVQYEMMKIEPKNGGKPIWMSNNTFAYYNSAIDEMSIFSMGSDVTEIVDGRNRMALELERRNLLEEKSGVGFWRVDLEAKSLEWSSAVYQIHGVTRKDYKPEIESAIDFYHPNDRATAREAFEKVTREGGEFEFALRLILRDGSEVPVTSYGVAVTDDNGEVVRVLGLFKGQGED